MLTPEQSLFLENATAAAKAVYAKTSLMVSGQIAQAAFESAWGVRAVGNNYFGVKAHDCIYVLGAQTITTHESQHGVMRLVNAMFSSYVDMEHSFSCHALVLLHNFPSAYSAKTPRDYINALMKDPITGLSYATDPNYAKIFMSIVIAHNLSSLDAT